MFLNFLKLMMSSTFGEIIRNKRLKMKIGLRQFAKIVKLSPTFISKIENNHYKTIKEINVKLIAKTLGINHIYLMLKLGKLPEKYKRRIMQDPLEIKLFLEKLYCNEI